MSTRVKLEDVCERGSSNLRQSDVEGKTGNYPIYGAAGYIGNVDFFHQEKPYVAVVKDGAGIGRTTLLPAYSSVIGTMQYLLPKENVLPEYLCYVVRHMHLEKYFSGATIPHIYFRDYKNEVFNLDSLGRQAEIIEILSRVEKVISIRQQQLSALDDLIKARFVEVFGSQEDNPLRFNIGTLKDVADIYLGLTHTPTYVTEGKPFLSVRDISSGRIDFANCHYISEQEFASLPNGARPKPNDILFCRVGTIGKPVTIPEGTPEFGSFVSVGFLRKKRNVLNEYLKAWMEDPYFMKQVYDNVAGASQINLNTGWLKNFRILIPPIELQQQFASFVSQVDKSKVVVQKALDETRLLFDSLMQQYFG